MLHIFDALVKPIALYNAEIWAAYNSCYKSKTLEGMFDISLKSNCEFDKVNIRFANMF